MWLLFSLLSAFSHASYLAAAKRLIKSLSPYVLLSGSFFTAPIFLGGYIAIYGLPELHAKFFLYVAASVGLLSIGNVLLLRGLNITDLTLAAPIIALTPVFSLLISFFMLGETPSIPGALGIVILVLGLVLATFKCQKKNDCILEIDRKKYRYGFLFLFIVAFIYGVSANYDKLIATNAPIFFGNSLTLAVYGLVMFLIALSKKEFKVLRQKDNFLKICFIGLLLSASLFIWYMAVSRGFVAYSLAIKRLSVLISFLYGYFLFKEKDFVWRRLLGAVVVLAGLFMIIFFK